jgi:hypothetical protein
MAMRILPHRANVVPVVLAVAMIAVVAAAALGPATGTVSAASSCPYGTCSSSGPGLLTWAIGGLIALVILLIAAALIFQRRRQKPPTSGVTGWDEPTSGGAGGPESPAPAESAPYVETPDDIGTMGGGVAVAGGAAAAGSEAPGDIDSLMGELDRISGEILKRGPGKKGPPTIGEDETPPSGN